MKEKKEVFLLLPLPILFLFQNFSFITFLLMTSGYSNASVNSCVLQKNFQLLPNTNPNLPDTEAVISVSGCNDSGETRSVEIGTTAQYAGAITTLTYDGLQMINRGGKGYGRLFQMAAWKYGSGACYNPIEAGSRYLADEPDGSNHTNSRVRSFNVSSGYLKTVAQPALFRRRGDPVNNQIDCTPAFYNTQLPQAGQEVDSTTTFSKTVRMGVFGRPLITKILIRAKNKTPISNDRFVFQLYAALVSQMNKVYSVDIDECKLKPDHICRVESVNLEAVSTSGYNSKKTFIIATQDREKAFALYAPTNRGPAPPLFKFTERNGNDADVISATTNYTIDTAVSFNFTNSGADLGTDWFSLPIYVIVGNLVDVRSNLGFLIDRFESDL